MPSVPQYAILRSIKRGHGIERHIKGLLMRKCFLLILTCELSLGNRYNVKVIAGFKNPISFMELYLSATQIARL